MQRVAEVFAEAPLTVVGLHTVFEHHEAMQLPSLKAFLHEYRIEFPVGVDMPGEKGDPLPRTMREYAMRGTPTTVLIDAQGRLRRQAFGGHEDLILGAEIQTLLLEADALRHVAPLTASEKAAGCDDTGCPTPSRS